jgi:hypothetical protein
MSERTEALRDELRAIEIWDEDYRRGDNPPFVDTLAWRARRQRAAEIQCELERVGSTPGNESTDTSVPRATLYDQGCNGLPDPQLLKDARFLTKPFSRNELRE